MLEKSMKPNSVIVLRMLTGEEIVCRFSSESATHIIVDKPRMLMQTQEGVALVPIGLTVNPDQMSMPFNKNTIVTQWEPNKEVANSYMQATSSLKIPTGNVDLSNIR